MQNIEFNNGVSSTSRGRSYGCFSFLFDCLMVVLTGGFWIIWIFIREMRNN